MCGISGIAGGAQASLIQEMTDVIAHRGPDGEGVRCFAATDGRPPAALGHRRLSILDPTPRGAQPMASRDGRYWITYNGEIYNFRELRLDLEAGGARFETDCDTEVLLAMYVRHGAGMLDHLNGIFAFAVWDRERGEMFLARDRLGVKPLYYAQRDGVLYFASEIKSLLVALPSLGMNRHAVPSYLTFLWVPDPETMFEGVHVLPAGHCARFVGERLTISQYWDMTFAPEEACDEAWVSRLRQGVAESVERQMVSDVPLGAFLSGGVDSSAIVAQMSHVTEAVKTYTVGFKPEDLAYDIAPDDLRYSRQMAQEFAVDYHERLLEPNVVDLLPKLIWHMDEPVADGAAITTYLICQAASEELKVILSGMGADELFAGYPRHLAGYLARGADLMPNAFRQALGRLAPRLTVGSPGRLRGPRRNLKEFLNGIEYPHLERYLTHVSYYRREELGPLFSEDFRAETAAIDPFLRHRQHLENVHGEHWLNQMLYLDMKTFLPCLNLTYTDKMSMAASTEVRVPLLDDELVALSGRLPPHLKLNRTKRKYGFKKSQEGLLPHDVIWRPKAGFSAPLRSWLVGPLREMVDDLLSPATVAGRGMFDPAAVRRLVERNQAGEEDNAFRLWTLLTLELWQRTFVDATRAPTGAAT